jgi:hypothetical protein
MKSQTLRKMTPLALLLMLFFLFQSSQVVEDTVPIQIEIQVSPNVLNLLNQGEVVTIHTDIAYGLVVGSSVTLNGLEISHWKADDQGNFVAKFLMSAVKGLPLNIGGYNTLVLTGTTINGDTFTGSDAIKVVLNVPSKK